MSGYVQQVSSSFELDDISQAFPDLFFQGQYKIDVDLWTHAGQPNLRQVQ